MTILGKVGKHTGKGRWPSWKRWVTILWKVGDYHRDGGLMFTGGSVNVLGMVGELPGVDDGRGEGWWPFYEKLNLVAHPKKGGWPSLGRLVTIRGKVSDHPRKGRWAIILEMLVTIDGKISLRRLCNHPVEGGWLSKKRCETIIRKLGDNPGKGASSWESWVPILGIEDDCPVWKGWLSLERLMYYSP